MMRIGIIGFGGAGGAHLSYYSCIPEVKVTKVFDTKPAGLKRASAYPSVETCSDLDQFWKNLDAVSICTPDETHADYIVQALDRGLHVLCEKPLTNSLEGIKKILQAEKGSNKTLAALHQMRFVPLHVKMKALLEKNALGLVSYFEGYYVHNLTERAFQFDDWRGTSDSTPLIYAGCHFIDLLRWLAKEEIEEIHAYSNNIAFPRYPEADLTLASMRFKNGIIGKVLVTFGSACPQDHSVRIYGNKGCVDNNILFDQENKKTVIHSPILFQRELIPPGSRQMVFKKSYRQFKNNLPHYLSAKVYEWLDPLLGRRRDGEYYNRYAPVRLYEHRLACLHAIKDFIRAAQASVRPICTAEDAAKTVLTAIAGVESSRTGQPVKVPPLTDVL